MASIEPAGAGTGTRTAGMRRRLRRDVVRMLISLAVTVPVSTALFLALLVAVPKDGERLAPRGVDSADVIVAIAASWLTFTVIYGLLTRFAFARLEGEELRREVAASSPQSRRGRIILRVLLMDEVTLPLSAAVLGILGVIVLIVKPELRGSGLVIASGFAIMASSWALMIVAFTVTFLRDWASHDSLAFRDEGPRRFDDFGYAAIQVATTFATSDVDTRSTRIRNWVSLNSILAFVFNTVIIALFLTVATSGA